MCTTVSVLIASQITAKHPVIHMHKASTGLQIQSAMTSISAAKNSQEKAITAAMEPQSSSQQPRRPWYLLLGCLAILLNCGGSTVLLTGIGQALQVLHVNLIGAQPLPVHEALGF